MLFTRKRCGLALIWLLGILVLLKLDTNFMYHNTAPKSSTETIQEEVHNDVMAHEEVNHDIVTAALSSNYTIPHIIHQTWDSYKVPKVFAAWIKSWAKNHPDWEYWFWTPNDVRLLIRQHYPDFLDEYDNYTKEVFRANSMRYLIMYHFGGIYADLDLESLKPMDPWTQNHSCILPENTYAHPMLLKGLNRSTVMITLLASRPGHPYFAKAIDLLPTYVHMPYEAKLVYADMVYLDYMKTRTSKLPGNDITLGHPKYFLPTYDPGWSSKFRDMCSDKKVKTLKLHQQSVCQEFKNRRFKNVPYPESYTTHYWYHVIMKNEQWKKQNTVSIFDLMPHAENVSEVLLRETHTIGHDK